MKDYQKLAEDNAPCIVVCPRKEYRDGKWVTYGLTVLAESSPNTGHSQGKGARYDYGLM